jgi:hypothetical protein
MTLRSYGQETPNSEGVSSDTPSIIRAVAIVQQQPRRAKRAETVY